MADKDTRQWVVQATLNLIKNDEFLVAHLEFGDVPADDIAGAREMVEEYLNGLLEKAGDVIEELDVYAIFEHKDE